MTTYPIKVLAWKPMNPQTERSHTMTFDLNIHRMSRERIPRTQRKRDTYASPI